MSLILQTPTENVYAEPDSKVREGLAAPSVALTDRLAAFRIKQKYPIQYNNRYIATTYCSDIGKYFLVYIEGREFGPYQSIDCAWDYDVDYREYHNLIVDLPLELMQSVGRRNWTRVMIVEVSNTITRYDSNTAKSENGPHS